MAIDSVSLKKIEKLRAGTANAHDIQMLASFIEWKMTVLADQTYNTQLKQNIIEIANALSSYRGASLPSSLPADAATPWAYLQRVLEGATALAGGGVLAQTASVLPIVGITIGAIAIAGGLYWYMKRGKR